MRRFGRWIEKFQIRMANSQTNLNLKIQMQMTQFDHLDLTFVICLSVARLRFGNLLANTRPFGSDLGSLRIRREGWLTLVEHFESRFKNFAGHVDELREAAIRAGKRCLRGIRECSKGFL